MTSQFLSHDTINTALSRDSNYVVMLSKFGISSISMRNFQGFFLFTRYGVKLLHNYGKRVQTKSLKVWELYS